MDFQIHNDVEKSGCAKNVITQLRGNTTNELESDHIIPLYRDDIYSKSLYNTIAAMEF